MGGYFADEGNFHGGTACGGCSDECSSSMDGGSIKMQPESGVLTGVNNSASSLDSAPVEMQPQDGIVAGIMENELLGRHEV